MSSLKDVFPSNNLDMSLTPDVSHFLIWPYIALVAALSENHAVTAIRNVMSFIVPSHHSAAVLPTPHDVDAHWVP